MNPVSHAVFSRTVKLAQKTSKFLFVEHDGSLPAAGGAALGTLENDGNANDRVAVTVLGVGIATSAAAIADGAAIKVDAAGKALTHDGNNKIVGRALAPTTEADQQFPYLCIPN